LRQFYNEMLHDLYRSPLIIRVIETRWIRSAEHVAHVGEKQDMCRIFVRKHEGLGVPRRGLVDKRW